MYKKMLVPLDGSDLAEVVLPYAKEIAGRLDLDVILLHVYSPAKHDFIPMHQVYIERMAEIVRSQSQEVQEKAGVQPRGKVVKVRGELAVGHPAEEILRYADKNNVDLILIATHGHSGIKRWAMGSVADKVLRAANVPVWLVRAGIPQEIVHAKDLQKILVTLDGSQVAETILHYVKSLAKGMGSELILLEVIEPIMLPHMVGYRDQEEYEQRLIAKAEEEAKRYLNKKKRALRGEGIKVRSVLLRGQPTQTILQYAEDKSVSLIALTTHGFSGIAKWVYGSVASNIVEASTRPIFLVRSRYSDLD